jgi:hypothetical protein
MIEPLDVATPARRPNILFLKRERFGKEQFHDFVGKKVACGHSLRPPVHTKTDRDRQSHRIFLVPRKQLPRQDWMI